MKQKRNQSLPTSTSTKTAAGDAASTPATADSERNRLVRKLQESARFEHGYGLIGSVYRHQLKAVIGDDKEMLESAVHYVLDMLKDFGPRDPVEEMLVAQMIQTHARMTYLNTFAFQQTNLKWAAMMHEAADRAANTFRRQMLALAEYRRPRRANSFTAIAQANIAQQQVVQNRNSGNEKEANEQGSNCKSEGPKMLPADGKGPEIPAERR